MTLNSVTVTGKEVKDERLVRVTWVWIDILHMLLHMNVDGRKLYQAGQPAHPDPKSCSSKIFLQYRMRMHVCFGTYDGPHHHNAPATSGPDTLLKILHYFFKLCLYFLLLMFSCQ